MNHVPIIVITGGPSGGKTTSLIRLNEMLSARGYKVFVSSESATKLYKAGMRVGPGEMTVAEFQKAVLLDTIEQEARLLDAAAHYAAEGKKAVVLCDRGTMDGEAYLDKATFAAMLESLSLDPREVCDKRYDAVIHLRTAAVGAEAAYTLHNNSARKETIEQAKIIDQKTLEAWKTHPHLRVIENTSDFEAKIAQLFAEVSAVLEK